MSRLADEDNGGAAVKPGQLARGGSQRRRLRTFYVPAVIFPQCPDVNEHRLVLLYEDLKLRRCQVHQLFGMPKQIQKIQRSAAVAP